MIIKVACPGCGKTIKVDVKTLDALRAENDRLRREILDLKSGESGLRALGRMFSGK